MYGYRFEISMKMLLSTTLLGVTVSTCQLAPIGGPEPVEYGPEGAEIANSLTQDEQSDQWKLLFNGKDLENWRGFKMEEVPRGWNIDSGSIHFDEKTLGSGAGDLTTKEQFSDFELTLEWKISPGANSGIFYRVTEDYDEEYMSGPEFQIIDDKGYPAELEGTQLSGSNYGLQAPNKDVVRPPGEWNQTRLLVNGSHVEHWLNGHMVVEYDLWTDQWREMVGNSKFAAWSGYGMSPKGHIVLQDYGAPVWFRNIKVKSLRPLGQDP